MEFLLIWMFSVIIGVLIGSAKGRMLSGLVWSFLFGPLGVLVVLCLANPKKEKAAREEKERQEKIIRLQEEQLRELRAMRQPPQEQEEQMADFIPESMRGASVRKR